MRVALCEEYNPRENKTKISDIILSGPKSGFGTANIKGNFSKSYFKIKFTFSEEILVAPF